MELSATHTLTAWPPVVLDQYPSDRRLSGPKRPVCTLQREKISCLCQEVYWYTDVTSLNMRLCFKLPCWCSSALWYTRWFKYDRDWLHTVYTQISPGHIWTTLYKLYCIAVETLWFYWGRTGKPPFGTSVSSEFGNSHSVYFSYLENRKAYGKIRILHVRCVFLLSLLLLCEGYFTPVNIYQDTLEITSKMHR